MSSVTEIEVNGKQLHLDVDADRTLLSVLSETLDLTGSKYGCGEGECGACTVLIDGAPVRSCRTRVGGVGTRKITTIEGLEQDGKLHPIQQAFLDAGAMQCAYCTSGMILSAYALLRKNANPSEPEISRSMEGNICRCGAYQRIVTAVQSAAAELRKAIQ